MRMVYETLTHSWKNAEYVADDIINAYLGADHRAKLLG